MKISPKILGQRGTSHIAIPLICLLVIALIGVRVVIIHDQNSGNKQSSTATNVEANNSDNGKTINVSVGQRVDVLLSNSVWTFSIPDNQHVIQYVSKAITQPSARYPLGTATAVYKTLTSGHASISATAIIRPHCAPSTICPEFIAISRYTLNLNVTEKH